MLKINGKTFMNIQEAVQWLLDNNCIPFQCTANYVADTEIGLGTIVNPSSAKVRIGSLIFFADSKVSTVVGITSNGFIVSDQYNDLVDDVVYVSNVAIDASGHLIVTLSNGDNIDAGLIKQVSSFSINGSQHLIVNYNDDTSQDLGAIFSGNVNIDGNFSANSIIETMTGYSAGSTAASVTLSYQNVVKNGNKITFVAVGKYTAQNVNPTQTMASFIIPSAIGSQFLQGTIAGISAVSVNQTAFVKYANDSSSNVVKNVRFYKVSNTEFSIQLLGANTTFTVNEDYFFRSEITLTLGTNMA